MGLAEDLAREYGVDFEEAPKYSEIIERFGEEVSSDRAVEVTNTLQRQYSNLVAFGGVTGSEHIWGARPSRDTTRDLDFVSNPRAAAEFAGDCGESWLYDGTVVSVVECDGEEWMVGNLPCAAECFHSEHMAPFSVDPVEVLEPEIVDTPYGDIATVSAAACASSKFRRYVQNKLERGGYKDGDLVDMCNIFMADLESSYETNIERREFKRRCREIRGQGIETDEVYNDMFNSIQGSNAEIHKGEFEGLWSRKLETALDEALD